MTNKQFAANPFAAGFPSENKQEAVPTHPGNDRPTEVQDLTNEVQFQDDPIMVSVGIHGNDMKPVPMPSAPSVSAHKMLVYYCPRAGRGRLQGAPETMIYTMTYDRTQEYIQQKQLSGVAGRNNGAITARGYLINVTDATKGEMADGKPLAKAYTVGKDTLSVYAQSLDRQSKEIIPPDPLMAAGQAAEEAVRHWLMSLPHIAMAQIQTDQSVQMNNDIDIICTTKSGVTVYVQVKADRRASETNNLYIQSDERREKPTNDNKHLNITISVVDGVLKFDLDDKSLFDLTDKAGSSKQFMYSLTAAYIVLRYPAFRKQVEQIACGWRDGQLYGLSERLGGIISEVNLTDTEPAKYSVSAKNRNTDQDNVYVTDIFPAGW